MVKDKKVLVDGKPVIYKSTKNSQPISTIKEAYAKIPDDKRIPVVFETKTQYLNEYIKNQEKKKGVKFTPAQEKMYKHTELRDMKNIVSRYTTNHNPYIDKRVVFFTDKKMPKAQFEKSVMHEYGHELWEKNPKIRNDWNSISKRTSPTPYGRTDKQEDFAESYMLAKTGQLRDSSRNRIIQKDTKGRNSVADAMNEDIDPNYEYTDEWKLYGGPKNYNPNVYEATDLKGNIKSITNRFLTNINNSPVNALLRHEVELGETPLGNKISTLTATDSGYIKTDTTGLNRKFIKTKGNKTFYEPQGKTGISLPVYKTTRTQTPYTPRTITPMITTPPPTIINPNLLPVKTLSNFKRRGITVTTASEEPNTTPIGSSDKMPLVDRFKGRVNLYKQGLSVYNAPTTPQRKINLIPKSPTPTLPKEPRKMSSIPGVPLWHNRLGDFLNYAEQHRLELDKEEAQRRASEEQRNQEIQTMYALKQANQLTPKMNKEFMMATQLPFFSTDLKNNFGVIRAGVTYTPYPIEQKHAFALQEFNDPDKEKELLKDKSFTYNQITGGKQL
jgi:hypothetical protein